MWERKERDGGDCRDGVASFQGRRKREGNRRMLRRETREGRERGGGGRRGIKGTNEGI